MNFERRVRRQLWWMQSPVFRLLSWFMQLGISRRAQSQRFGDSGSQHDDRFAGDFLADTRPPGGMECGQRACTHLNR